MTKKFLIIIVSCMVVFATFAYAQEHSDHSEHDNMEHNNQDDSNDHSDHRDHVMDHSAHESGQNNDDTDHRGHSDHAGHDMDHSMHERNQEDDGDDHSGMMHGDDHLMDTPGDHIMLHDDGDSHSGHRGDHHHHHDDSHIMDHEGGMIMGQNFDKLPSSCSSISQEIEITVKAGAKYAKNFPGLAFAFDEQQWKVEPCSKITWHFINEDEVRHQFMMHGLPRYLYKLGMFHLESTGPRKISGTMIVPAADETYLVHCDIAQHMEKGMKAQLVVGNGGEDIPSIPGLTPYVINDIYKPGKLTEDTNDGGNNEKDSQSTTQQVTDFFSNNLPFSGMILIGLLFGVTCAPLFANIVALRKKREKEADN